MNFYGEELLQIGIALIIISLAAAAVFTAIHLAMSSKLKKRLEKEYGKNK